MEAQLEHACVAHTFWHIFVPICMLGWCSFSNISASELSWKFIKSECLVGTGTKEGENQNFWCTPNFWVHQNQCH